jgi:hypothetical protein
MSVLTRVTWSNIPEDGILEVALYGVSRISVNRSVLKIKQDRKLDKKSSGALLTEMARDALNWNQPQISHKK